jgi:transcription elongation factor GreB
VSRAFVKDDDDRPERPPPRPVGDQPNYVTAAGLKLLQDALAAARAESDERNVEYYERRIESAQLVERGGAKRGTVAFGSTVVARDEKGGHVRVRIVGEDEADPAHGSISWLSPYAQALLERRAGDRVVVARPAGPATIVIEAVE